MASQQIFELTAGSGIDGTQVIPSQIAAGGEDAKKYTFADIKKYSVPYKSYVATLAQSGTAAPTATVLQNELGGTVVWTRTGTGVYIATLSGAFTSNKTVCFVNNSIPDTQLQAYPTSVNAVELDQQNLASAAQDGLFSNCIEIRVYY